MMARLLKMMVGADGWYAANMLTSGDIKPPILLTMEPKPEAVCLKPTLVVSVFITGKMLHVSAYRKEVGNSSCTYTEQMDPAQFRKIRPAVTSTVTATA